MLTEQPRLLENIMITSEYSPEGVYQMRLCKDGQWKVVTVDDLLPCSVHDSLLYSSVSTNQSLLYFIPQNDYKFATRDRSAVSLFSSNLIENYDLQRNGL